MCLMTTDRPSMWKLTVRWGGASKALEDDYGRMVEDGLPLEDAKPFEAFTARCADITPRANRAAE